MHVPFEASIISYRAMDPPRPLLAVYPASIVDALSFLPLLGWTRGVVSREDPSAGTSRRLRHLDRVVIAPNGIPATGSIHSGDSSLDFTFVPSNRVPRLKHSARLWQWAVEHRMPYVHVHDDDHAWWCNVTTIQKRTLFAAWLLRCALHSTLKNQVKIAPECWRAISRGLSSHGWTLAPSGCASKRGTVMLRLEPQHAVPLVAEVRAARGKPVALRLTLPVDGYDTIRIESSER